MLDKWKFILLPLYQFTLWLWSRLFTIYPKCLIIELDGPVKYAELPKGRIWERRIRYLSEKGQGIAAKKGYGIYIHIMAAGLGELETSFIGTWKLLEMTIDVAMEESK